MITKILATSLAGLAATGAAIATTAAASPAAAPAALKHPQTASTRAAASAQHTARTHRHGGRYGTLSCATAPSTCGYPDASNTGVPAGTSLKNVPGDVSSGPGWSYDSRGWVTVDGNGAVLSGLNIGVNVNVTASNVTIQNTKITASGGTFGISLRHTTNVTIKNDTVTGVNSGSGRLMTGIKDVYGDSTGLQITADNINNTGTGIKVEGGLIEGNYIHDMGYIAGDHTNGITSNGGVSTQLTIRHNTIFNSLSQTDAIGLFEDFGVQQNRTIDNNLLSGGSYALYAGQNAGGPATSNISVTSNHFATNYYPKSGSAGPATAYNANGTGNTWTGNTWDNTGATINHP